MAVGADGRYGLNFRRLSVCWSQALLSPSNLLKSRRKGRHVATAGTC